MSHYKHGECCSDDHSGCQENKGCSCGCGCSNCGCCQESSCGEHCQTCGNEHKNYADELLCLADCAWSEVLKEKIKEEIKSKSSDHLDELAKLVAGANCERWEHKLAGKKVKHGFQEKLASFFEGSCCKDKCDTK